MQESLPFQFKNQFSKFVLRSIDQNFSAIMKFLCFMSSILLSFISDVNSIDGGYRANPGEFPYVVAIWMSGHHHCSGSIIDETHILTAAHCVYGFQVRNFAVLPGVVDYETDSIEWFSVRSYHAHPLFESVELRDRPGVFLRHDIAIMTLTRPLNFNGTLIKPAVLSDQTIDADEPIGIPHAVDDINAMINDEIFDCPRMDEDSNEDDDDDDDYHDRCSLCGVNYKIPGWEYVATDNEKLLYLLWAEAIVYSYKICVRQRKILFENQLCAGDLEESTIAGPGDSGTPVVFDEKVIGIVNSGSRVTHGAILTTILRTLPYLSFIEETVAANSYHHVTSTS